ncbi:Anaphase-promoting complex (APC) subunit 11 protein [Dioscorea alata]|uniref:Anaphase-promoting complex (APC) subunit 11 protein n=1 Tax=Dioscorea alata TaxID=55571 RepID=A0ACB7WCK8_DIOAL|nr:Anaphase-promoting complex (APC) subunit 11 protein [Dioscorea alata]
MASSMPAILYQHSRRSLLEATISGYTVSSVYSTTDDDIAESDINTTVFIILSAMICIVICALVLYTITRCVIKITRFIWVQSELEFELVNGSKTRRLVTLPVLLYSNGLDLTGAGGSECAICLSEFFLGEEVRVLPGCNHGFHVNCIDRWLKFHPTCPNCRRRMMPCSMVVISVNNESTAVDHPGGC